MMAWYKVSLGCKALCRTAYVGHEGHALVRLYLSVLGN